MISWLVPCVALPLFWLNIFLSMEQIMVVTFSFFHWLAIMTCLSIDICMWCVADRGKLFTSFSVHCVRVSLACLPVNYEKIKYGNAMQKVVKIHCSGTSVVRYMVFSCKKMCYWHDITAHEFAKNGHHQHS